MHNLLIKIGSLLAIPFLFIGNLLSPTPPSPAVGSSLPSGVAVFETSLQSAITSTASSMELVANSVRGGGSLSGFQCFTLDEGTSIREDVCGTVSGTTVSGMTRGIDPITATSTNATLQFSHRRGTQVKQTDFPLLQLMRNQLSGSETIANPLFYATHPTFISGTQIVDKTYADGLSFNGVATSSESNFGGVWLGTKLQQASSTDGGVNKPYVLQTKNATSTCNSGLGGLFALITRNDNTIDPSCISASSSYAWTGNNTFSGAQTFSGQNTFNATTTVATTTINGSMFGGNIVNNLTAGMTITGEATPQAVMIATTTGQVSLSQANVASTTDFVGFAINNSTLGGIAYIQTDGVVKFSGLTAGADYYVQNTAGTIGTSMGTNEIYVGRAISTTQLLILKNRSMQYSGSSAMSQGTCDTVNCSVTVTIPNLLQVRFVGVSWSFSGNPASSAGSGILIKNGLTSISGHTTTNNSGTSSSCSWSGAVVTCSVSSSIQNSSWSGSGTVYFYR